MGNSKNILRVFLSLVIILIPSYLAVYNIYNMNTDELIIENVTQIVVASASGEAVIYDRPADLRNFIKAVNEARALTREPRDFAAETPAHLIVYKIGERTLEYDMFLNLDPELCVLRNSDGEFFHIRTEDARLLLAEPVSDALFEFNRLPVAGVPQGESVAAVYPAEGGVWRLRKADDNFYDTSVPAITAENNIIKIAQNRPFEINFNIDPDIISIEAFDNKELIFTGLLSQLSDFNFDTRKELQFIVTAEWNESEFNNFYGEAVYNIDVIYEVPANFSISNHEAEPGGLIIITAFNVGASDNIILACPELDYQAGFVQWGDNKIGLLPVSSGFTGVLSINIEGDYTDNFSVSVSPKPVLTRNVGAADENLAAHLSSTARNERLTGYDGIISKASSAQKLWEDNFINPSPLGGVLFEFGTNITVNMGNAHVSQGANLEINTGDSVSAGNAGTIIYAGRLPYDGNLLVIDHGGGLRTWYGRLDQISVQEGESVSAGQEIATAGRSGMPTSPGLGLYFAASVGDIFIDPVILFNLNLGILPEPEELPEVGEMPEPDPGLEDIAPEALPE